MSSGMRGRFLLSDGRAPEPEAPHDTIEMVEVWPRWWMPKSTVDWHKRMIFKIQVAVICAMWTLIAFLMIFVGMK